VKERGKGRENEAKRSEPNRGERKRSVARREEHLLALKEAIYKAPRLGDSGLKTYNYLYGDFSRKTPSFFLFFRPFRDLEHLAFDFF
jgi:hypothetical protein